ncbi:MAG TPA: hypothetical protein ENL41_00965, partial [candidate division WOR-3 bacterium]|nr:hypothetical protein [candidate division WOR-3 bacterium]
MPSRYWKKGESSCEKNEYFRNAFISLKTCLNLNTGLALLRRAGTIQAIVDIRIMREALSI